jgi:hypothetical protein
VTLKNRLKGLLGADSGVGERYSEGTPNRNSGPKPNIIGAKRRWLSDCA